MSNINPQNIDGTFPIAGQDNDSQGFRDNFTNTINNFTFAAAELTDLQKYAVLTAPLSSVGQTGSPTNNMNYTLLTKPQLKGAVETVNSFGNVSGAVSVDWSVASFQTLTTSGNVTLSFASTWPTSNLYGRVRVEVTPGNAAHTLTLPAQVSVGLNNLSNANVISKTITFDSTDVRLYEFTTYNNGSTITIIPLLQP